MYNLSDLIEEFILNSLGEDEMLNLSRNDLAQYFKCAPSQINYVLSTRFNIDRGFLTESQRGGGGYIRITRTKIDDSIKDYINNKIGDKISYKNACFVLEDLENKGIINQEQAEILSIVVSPKALSCPLMIEDNMRSSILKNTLIKIIGEV